MPKWPSLYKKNTDRRKEWTALKKKHAAALKASKVDFDTKLGASIDKFERQVKKMAVEGFGKKSVTADWVKVGAAAKQLTSTAKTYQGKLGALPATTKSDMSAFLKDLEEDGTLWSAAAKAPTPLTGGPSLGKVHVHIFEMVGVMRTLRERGKQYVGRLVSQRAAEFTPPAGSTNPDPQYLAKANPARLAYLGAVEAQMAKVLEVLPAAEQANKRLDTIGANSVKDATYVPVFKEAAKKAVAKPFAQLKQALVDLRAIPFVGAIPPVDIAEATMVDVAAKHILAHIAEVEAAAQTY